MTASPLLLSYDDLPPGSDIRREHSPGLIRITVPTGEPSEAEIRRVQRASILTGALASFAVLAPTLTFVFWLARVNRVVGVSLGVAQVALVILCIAIVASFAWQFAGTAKEALFAVHQQVSVLAITPDRLLVETKGPFGHGSYDFDAAEIAAVRVNRFFRHFGARTNLNHLTIELHDGRWASFLPGRDRVELNFVASAIRQMLARDVRPT